MSGPRSALLVAVSTLLCSCGGAPPAAPGWRTCTLQDVRGAGGLALHGDDLLVVCGGDDRQVYAVALGALEPGARVAVRVLEQQVDERALLMGGEPMAMQGYQLAHLGEQKVDFQALAVQPPHFLYLGDRLRRVAWWGTLLADPAGRTDRLRVRGAFVVPGATRSGSGSGDWRDRGPGLAGFVSVGTRRRTEDFYAVDRAAPAGGLLLHKVNRYSSALGRIPVRHEPRGAVDIEGLSLDGGAFWILHGPGRLSAIAEPRGGEAGRMRSREAAPEPPAAHAWTGMCHGPGGVLYVVSSGDPAHVAWRRP